MRSNPAAFSRLLARSRLGQLDCNGLDNGRFLGAGARSVPGYAVVNPTDGATAMNQTNLVMPEGAWKHGKVLIASRDAVLPPYCVKCGRPADAQPLRRRFSWHPSWIYIFLLIALLIYVILAAVLSKRTTLQLPLCAAHFEKYKTLRILAAVLLVGSIPEMILAGVYLPDHYMGWGIFAGLLAFLAGLVCWILFSGVLRINRIDEHYGYFSKACEGFLAHLPPPPAGMMLPSWPG